MFRVLLWIFVFVAFLWLVQFLKILLAASLGRLRVFERFPGGGPFPVGSRNAGATPTASRELQKDPQCGTYLAPELSIQFRDRDQVLYFCSRECEQKFLQGRSQKTA